MIRIRKLLPGWRPWTRCGNACNSLHSADRMRAILDRERMRSDRGNSTFAVLTLAFAKQREELDLAALARIFRKRLRATDDAGLLCPRRVAVVLPETSAEGAWKLSDDICELLPAEMRRPVCDVYVYPPEPAQTGNETGTKVGPLAQRATAQPMHVLFVPSLPAWKRAIDVIGAATALVLGAPLMLLVAALTRWESRAPILYRQERIGRHGRRFKVWKFRTMVHDADRILNDYLAACPLRRAEWDRDHKLRDDPRITKLGRWLRKTSVDELPQLWNVLRGEMSLVGPRPIVTAEIAKYGKSFKPYCSVLPGLTGLWQISGRNETTYAERVELDSYYARNWSVWLDLYILAMTVRVVLFRQGAY